MFWRVAALATPSPVDAILDKGEYTLEELLDEDDLIQECKSFNQRLVTFLRSKAQIDQLLQYVVEEPSPEADDKRQFKYPFVSCEVFTCEIDQVFNTLLESEELLDKLYSFVNSDQPHSNLLAGYFSKVAMCLLVRKTPEMMAYLQAHQGLLQKLVDLIGITSIMEVVMKVAGADDQILMYHADSVQWLSETKLLDTLIEKLEPQYPPDVHANTAETLSAIARTAPSALASQLSSPRYVGALFHHVLEEGQSKTGVIHSLSVCITLLDPKRAANAAIAGAARGINEPLQAVNPETIEGMLQKLGDLLALLDVSGDDRTLPTTYGELKPPFGMHRLKVIEFIAVLLRTKSEVVRQELVRLNGIQIALDLFFRFPFNNQLHHHVESLVNSCLESDSPPLIDNLVRDCNLLDRIVTAYSNEATSSSESTKVASRCGYMGHLTKIANKMCQVAKGNPHLAAYLQSNVQWSQWQTTVLQERNEVEYLNSWQCGRPTALDDRTGDSDEDSEYSRSRDYDLPNSSHNVSREHNHRYGVFDDSEEVGEYDLEEGRAGQGVSSLQIGGDNDSDDEQEMVQLRQVTQLGRGSQANSLQRYDSDDSDEEADGTLSGQPSTLSVRSPPDLWDDNKDWSGLQRLPMKVASANDFLFDDDEGDELDTATSAGPSSVGAARAGEGGAPVDSPVNHEGTGGAKPQLYPMDLFVAPSFSFSQPPQSSYPSTSDDFFASARTSQVLGEEYGEAGAKNPLEKPSSVPSEEQYAAFNSLFATEPKFSAKPSFDVSSSSSEPAAGNVSLAESATVSSGTPLQPLGPEDGRKGALDSVRAAGSPLSTDTPSEEVFTGNMATEAEFGEFQAAEKQSLEEAHTSVVDDAPVSSGKGQLGSPDPPQETPTVGSSDAAVPGDGEQNTPRGARSGEIETGVSQSVEKAIREGIVGEAGPLHTSSSSDFTYQYSPRPSLQSEKAEFNDVNYWKSPYAGTQVEEASEGAQEALKPPVVLENTGS